MQVRVKGKEVEAQLNTLEVNRLRAAQEVLDGLETIGFLEPSLKGLLFRLTNGENVLKRNSDPVQIVDDDGEIM